MTKPSEEIRAAITVVHQQLILTKRAMYTTGMKEIPVAPLVAWLEFEAAHYALYDGRGWPAERIDVRMSSSSRAALEFARSLVGGTEGLEVSA